MKPNTERILELLKAKGPLTSGQINKVLNIKAATARCAEMAKRGLLVDVGDGKGKRWAIATIASIVEKERKRAVRVVVRKCAEAIMNGTPASNETITGIAGQCAPRAQQRAWYIVKSEGPFAESPTAYTSQKRANAVAKKVRNGQVITANEIKG